MQKSFLIQCDSRFAANEPEQDSFTHLEEPPLSEGFHWESLPDSPSFAPLMGLPPPVEDTPPSRSPTEPQSSPLMPEPLEELPGQEDNARQTVAVKVETTPAEENGAVADQSTAKTSKNTVRTVSELQRGIDGISY